MNDSYSMGSTISRFILRTRLLFEGHIFVPVFLSKENRRKKRYAVYSSLIPDYFAGNYLYAAKAGIENMDAEKGEGEKVFILWLQGEKNAPKLIQRCIDSVRKNCSGKEIIILDKDSLKQYTSIPEYIWKKFESKQMTMAQFSDICRVDLLYRYGGYWIDSTCFMISKLPKELDDLGFFCYMAGQRMKFNYSFIQSCFIHAKKGSKIIAGTRAMIFEFWRKENSKIDYFQFHLMLKAVVENIPSAAEEFAAMPKIDQDATHYMWFEHPDDIFDHNVLKQLASEVLFQKTTYRDCRCLSNSNRSFILGS